MRLLVSLRAVSVWLLLAGVLGAESWIAGATSSSVSSVVEASDVRIELGPIALVADSGGDGVADPGDAVTIAVPIQNLSGSTTVDNLTATLTGGSSASYGTLAPGQLVSQTFTYHVPGDVSCGTALALTFQIDSSLGAMTRTALLQVGFPTGAAPSTEFGTGDVAVSIPDVSTVEIPIEVRSAGFVGDVDVSVRLNHTFVGDLVMSLVAPDGTSVLLVNRRGVGGDNFGAGPATCSGTPTVFDDQAATAITSGTPPFAGSFRPEASLSAMKGRGIAGTWKLRISDSAPADVGVVYCVRVIIQEQLFFCPTVPGSATVRPAGPPVVLEESAVPANGAPDPDETVTMSFPLENVGTGAASNLVATLLETGGVSAPSGPVRYGALSPTDGPVGGAFTFVPSGTCGGSITATFQLTDAGVDLGTVSFPVTLGAGVMTTTTLNNPAQIDIPASGIGATAGASAPYPSTLNVSGLAGTVEDVRVTLHGLSHTFPADIDVLLVGPSGRGIILLSDAGGSTNAVNLTLTMHDGAANLAQGTLAESQTFRPTNFGGGDTFPPPLPQGVTVFSPAPAGTETLASRFRGTDPNGDWQLYVVDDATGDVGSIAGGWSLTLTTRQTSCVTSQCTLTMTNNTAASEPGSCSAIVNYGIGVAGSCGVVSGSPASGSVFPVGSTPVTLVGTRQDGSRSEFSAEAVVTGAGLPVIANAWANPSVLWSPNHEMADVTVNYTVGNTCGTGDAKTTLSVQSNEPVNGTGDGDTTPDWEVVDSHHVRLRRERAGHGTGRIYTITITATDAAGNVATAQVLVVVPHDGQAVGAAGSRPHHHVERAGVDHTRHAPIDE